MESALLWFDAESALLWFEAESSAFTFDTESDLLWFETNSSVLTFVSVLTFGVSDSIFEFEESGRSSFGWLELCGRPLFPDLKYLVKL